MGSCNFIVPNIVTILLFWFVKATAEAPIMICLSISHKPQGLSIESNPPSLKCWLMTYCTESTEFLILTCSVSMINISQYSYFYAIVPIYFYPFYGKRLYFIIFSNCYCQLSPLKLWKETGAHDHSCQGLLISISLQWHVYSPTLYLNLGNSRYEMKLRNEYSMHSMALWPKCIRED